MEAEGPEPLLSLGFMRRFDPQHLALKHAVDSGTIGRPVLFRGVHRNPSPAPGATTRLVVTGSAIHDIDTARWVLGEIESVRATGRSVAGGDGLDLVLIEATHVAGGLSTIEVFVNARYGYEVTAEVVGEAGVVTTLPGDLTVTRLSGEARTPYPDLWLDRFAAAYTAELASWVDSLDGTAAFAGAGARDGYADQAVAEAVLESLTAGDVIEVRI
jgi:myo-inositol 2-dehydrogenase/D-chiro-inositol 1-dehydrogenase